MAGKKNLRCPPSPHLRASMEIAFLVRPHPRGLRVQRRALARALVHELDHAAAPVEQVPESHARLRVFTAMPKYVQT